MHFNIVVSMTITAKQVNSQLRSSTAQFGEGPAQWVILSYRFNDKLPHSAVASCNLGVLLCIK